MHFINKIVRNYSVIWVIDAIPFAIRYNANAEKTYVVMLYAAAVHEAQSFGYNHDEIRVYHKLDVAGLFFLFRDARMQIDKNQPELC